MNDYSDLPVYRFATNCRAILSGLYVFTGSTATVTLQNTNPAIMRPIDSRIMYFKNVGTGTLSIVSNSGNLFNFGAAIATFTLAPGQGAVIIPDNTNYEVISTTGNISPQVVTMGASPAVNCALGPVLSLSAALNTNPTFGAPSNVPAAGQPFTIIVTTDGGGARTVAWNAAYKNTSVFSATSGAGAQTSVFNFVSDGTNLVAVAANAWY